MCSFTMKIIRSSEIASYLFCPVSWWIGRTKGVKVTKMMVKGEKHHKLIAETQSKAKFLYVGMVVVAIVIIALVAYRFLG